MSEEQISEEEIREAAYASCKQLFLTLKERHATTIVEDAPLVDDIVHETLMHHKGHLATHKVQQRHIDGYKIISWSGCILLDKLVKTQKSAGLEPDNEVSFTDVSTAIVELLAGLLLVDKDIRLPDDTMDFLIRMLREEAYDNGTHGIWMNGLYAAFHCAVIAASTISEGA